jgi:SAM-dependent methyltransferase
MSAPHPRCPERTASPIGVRALHCRNLVDLPFGINPYENDPGAWGASLLNNAELLLAILDASRARSVAEVGAYAGDLTRLFLLWAEQAGATVVAIDPSPQPELEELERQRSELKLIRETSFKAFEHLELADVIVLDGDHNYYTVSEELRRIASRSEAEGVDLPLLLLHDVCWPHGRRDDYFDPEQVPPEHRQPITPEAGLYPGIETIREGGLPYHNPATREGGPRNGVLTAIDDFLASRDDVTLAIVPAFFGLGVVWRREAPYAEDIARVVAPWDRNPLLARLERNRVLHLASSHVQLRLATAAEEALQRHRELFERMLASRAFWAAEMFLRVRQRGRPAFSREEIRKLLARQ